MKKAEILKFSKLFADNNYATEEQVYTADHKTIMMSANNTQQGFHILFLMQQDTYLAYDLEVSYFPPEIYPDSLENGVSAAERNNEILSTVKRLLDKTIMFHPEPKLLKKERGYVVLPIDGKEQRIYMSKNPFV